MKKTKLQIIEEKYGVDFGVDDDVTLDQYLRKIGYGSLADLMEIKEVE